MFLKVPGKVQELGELGTTQDVGWNPCILHLLQGSLPLAPPGKPIFYIPKNMHIARENMWVPFKYLLILISNMTSQ